MRSIAGAQASTASEASEPISWRSQLSTPIYIILSSASRLHAELLHMPKVVQQRGCSRLKKGAI